MYFYLKNGSVKLTSESVLWSMQSCPAPVNESVQMSRVTSAISMTTDPHCAVLSYIWSKYSSQLQ